MFRISRINDEKFCFDVNKIKIKKIKKKKSMMKITNHNYTNVLNLRVEGEEANKKSEVKSPRIFLMTKQKKLSNSL